MAYRGRDLLRSEQRGTVRLKSLVKKRVRMAAGQAKGLYDPRNEHDACGVGFVVNIKGRKSHDIISRGLQILVNLDHRGAVGADPLMGDGAGCMIQMPDELLRHWATERGLALPPAGRYAVAMCFLPMDEKARAVAIQHIEHYVHAEGQTLLAWRDVGVDTTGLGIKVVETMPFIAQAIVEASPDVADQDTFERKILTIRKQVLNSIAKLADHLVCRLLLEKKKKEYLHPSEIDQARRGKHPLT